MENTGVKASKEDFERLQAFTKKEWMPGQPLAAKMCHQLALDYGLPEISGYYGIDVDGEFVTI